MTNQVEQEKKESNNLRIELEQALKSIQPLKDNISQLTSEISLLKKSNEAKEAQLNSSRSFITQLKAELQEHHNKKEETEKLQKEITRLQKEVHSK